MELWGGLTVCLPNALVVALSVIALCFAVSWTWLKVFPIGPLEWALRVPGRVLAIVLGPNPYPSGNARQPLETDAHTREAHGQPRPHRPDENR